MSDPSHSPQAIVILIDNSNTSIDGDFPPDRLTAQKDSAEILIDYFSKESSSTQISVGTLSQDKSKISSSLTSDKRTLLKVLSRIKPGASINFVQSLNCAFLVLHHMRKPDSVKNSISYQKRIIAFIASKFDLEEFKSKSQNLIEKAQKEKVSIDIIVLGLDNPNSDDLQAFIESIGPDSKFFIIDPIDSLLKIVTEIFCHNGLPENEDLSYLYAVESQFGFEDDIMDPALQQAILQSQEMERNRELLKKKISPVQSPQEPGEKKKRENEEEEEEGKEEEEEEEDSDELNDPGLQEAIRISKIRNAGDRTDE